jgi:hypothetical protein
LEIEFHRKRLGLTQSQLGDMIGVGQSQIANALRGYASAANRLDERRLERGRGRQRPQTRQRAMIRAAR